MRISFIAVLLLLSFSGSAVALEWSVCIDKQSPDAPSGLSASGDYVISWNVADDLPLSNQDCTFGIDYYNIYLDGNFIGISEGLSYSFGSLDDGGYVFGVSAVDRGGNEGDRAIKEVVFPLSSGGGSNSGGGSSGGGSSGGGSGRDDFDAKSGFVNPSDFENGTGEASEVLDFGTSSKDFGGDEDRGFFSFITGAVVGGAGSLLAALILIALILILYFFVKSENKVDKSKAVVASAASKKKVVKKKKAVKKKVKKVAKK